MSTFVNIGLAQALKSHTLTTETQHAVQSNFVSSGRYVYAMLTLLRGFRVFAQSVNLWWRSMCGPPATRPALGGGHPQRMRPINPQSAPDNRRGSAPALWTRGEWHAAQGRICILRTAVYQIAHAGMTAA